MRGFLIRAGLIDSDEHSATQGWKGQEQCWAEVIEFCQNGIVELCAALLFANKEVVLDNFSLLPCPDLGQDQGWVGLTSTYRERKGKVQYRRALIQQFF